VDPARLCLEVIESQSLVDLPTVAARLTELRRMGVRTALDDFGTGYSTLSWLQRLPVDRIKLDRTFITGLPEAPAQLLVRGVVALADQLGIEVVAEGVETPEQLAALQEAGCRLVQGYLLGRPEPVLPDVVVTEMALTGTVLTGTVLTPVAPREVVPPEPIPSGSPVG
jgi:EAL domain-containing protein (putative c-di-GMP-specific phosphodiesterase class I)